MEYRKILKSSYNLHLIKTDKFKTLFFKFVFRDDLIKEDVTIRNLLINMLDESTSKYNTNRLLNIRKEELYDLSTNFRNRRVGNQILSELSFEMIDTLYTEKSCLYETIDFIKEVIFNPLFTLEKLNLDKKLLYDDIKELDTIPNVKALLSLKRTMDSNNSFSIQTSGYLDDLEKITLDDIKTYYKKFINNSLIDIYVVGNIDFYEIEKLITENIKFNTIKKEKDSIYNNYINKKKAIAIKEDDSNYKQSKLCIGLNIKNPSDTDIKYNAILYNMILGNSPESLLFNNVREKKSLAYDVTSSYFKNDNIIIITTGINKENYKLCIDAIKCEIKNIENGNFTSSHLENCKTLIKSILKESFDFQNTITEYYFGLSYLKLDNIEHQTENIDKVTKEDIIEFSKKVKIDSIYFLKEN